MILKQSKRIYKSRKGKRLKYQQKDIYNNIICYKCLNYKLLDNFDNNNENFYRDKKDRRCKDCKREQYNKRKNQNRGKKDLNRILLERFLGLKERSKSKNLEVSITIEDLRNLWILQNGKCALSGINMTYIFNKGRTFTNVSIDRVDSKKGYTKDNIQLVCMVVNQMKSDLSKEELINFCKNIIEYNESKNN